MRHNDCLLRPKTGEDNAYCGGGVKEISVQDRTNYFDEMRFEVSSVDRVRARIRQQIYKRACLFESLDEEVSRYILVLRSDACLRFAEGELFGAERACV